ncbi:NAD-dependent epimerase/dehydratase family protein [Streptomyces sp. NPDC057682]|uniref:NAD-dependent epimerase/dehydratase family protein n=1 Tax=Streptomyces sp. NPDC057682 TaxID=3346210 RepID=UPI0036CD570E
MSPRLLITGATGFIGGRVAAAARATPGVRLRLMTHRTALGTSLTGPGVETVRGDLADPASLRGSCDGVDAVIHCASRLDADEATLRAVNDHGTRALVDEAVRAGAGRIVQLSTASVYGRGPFTALLPEAAPLAPVSAASRTRAAAERHVLEAQGAVLRPHLVYGTGDRWVVPGLVGLLRYLSAAPAGCPARHSMIDVESLGRALLGAALAPAAPSGVFHVNHPEPVGCSELLSTVLGALRPPGVDGEIGTDEAWARLEAAPRARHHFEMLAVDHWFDDDRAEKELDWIPGPAFAESFAAHASWYREFLAR